MHTSIQIRSVTSSDDPTTFSLLHCTRLSSHTAKASISTTSLVRDSEHALMKPCIGTVLDSFDDRQCLMVGAEIFVVRIFVQHGWPHDGTSQFWHDGQIEKGKVRTTSFFHIVEIQIQRQYSNTLDSHSVEFDVVLQDR